MKRNILFILAFIISSTAVAQHCPWDCAGMIIIQSPLSSERFYQAGLALVDTIENEREDIVVDTIFGTGKKTYDECIFLSYEDFTKRRSKKTAIHNCYGHDTMYHFTKGSYIVKFNYCKYQGKKLYIRYYDRYTRGLRFHYIEVPENKRIHLHNYAFELQERRTAELKKKTQPFVMKISCNDLGLRPDDCR